MFSVRCLARSLRRRLPDGARFVRHMMDLGPGDDPGLPDPAGSREAGLGARSVGAAPSAGGVR